MVVNGALDTEHDPVSTIRDVGYRFGHWGNAFTALRNPQCINDKKQVYEFWLKNQNDAGNGAGKISNAINTISTRSCSLVLISG